MALPPTNLKNEVYSVEDRQMYLVGVPCNRIAIIAR